MVVKEVCDTDRRLPQGKASRTRHTEQQADYRATLGFRVVSTETAWRCSFRARPKLEILGQCELARLLLRRLRSGHPSPVTGNTASGPEFREGADRLLPFRRAN